MHIDKDLVAALATPLVLAILVEGESYGYAILKRVSELSGGELSGPTGCSTRCSTVWNGSATCRPSGVVAGGRRRKYYVITRTAGSARRPAAAVGSREPRAERRLAGRRAVGCSRGGMRRRYVEPQIGEWRAFVAGRRRQRPRRRRAGGSPARADRRPQRGRPRDDEAFLIAVRRMGDVDAVPRVRARAQRSAVEAARPRGDRRAGAASPAADRCLGFAAVAAVASRSRGSLPTSPTRTELVRAQRQPVRAAVARRVLRGPAEARLARMGADGGAVRAAAVVVNVYPFEPTRAPNPRRDPPAGRAVVRGRLRVHRRQAPILRPADGLRPLHRRVGHLLRAHRAGRRRADGADRGHPRARRHRPRLIGAWVLPSARRAPSSWPRGSSRRSNASSRTSRRC